VALATARHAVGDYTSMEAIHHITHNLHTERIENCCLIVFARKASVELKCQSPLSCFGVHVSGLYCRELHLRTN
jgi:hypothetical protein